MRKLLVLLVVVAMVAAGWSVWSKNSEQDKGGNKQSAAFDKNAHSLSDPKSTWIIANKQRPLQPTNYQPNDLVAPDVPLRLTAQDEEMLLRREAATALEKLFAAAKKDGHELMLASAFRSYSYQSGLYNTYVQQQGQASADTQSARPGYSEHQTGWAADVEPASRECEVETCFANTPEGKWVAAHAHEFGFVVRYPKDRDETTGYIYEPWHLRYVGKQLAQELHDEGNPTLEDFFGLPPAPNYQ
jgi:D-alanyl-D-alanine carboxypeptidase